METVYLGLGTNEGNRGENLRLALKLLHDFVSVGAVSQVYESEPYGVDEPQAQYLNMALGGTTELSPRELLEHIQSVERKLGRTPDSHAKPRPMDIDILLYGDTVQETPELTIPHPRMHERAFVLAPLAEIAPLTVHPKLDAVVADLEDKLGDYSGLVWYAEEQL